MSAPGCLETFHGLWRGPGAVLGRAIVMQQRWAPAMGGAFTKWRMEHLSTDSSARVLFEGRTIYRRRGDELLGIDSVFPPAGVGREFGQSLVHIVR